MKWNFLPNYSYIQNPWLGGYRAQFPVLSALNWICCTPPSRTKFLGTPLIEQGHVFFQYSILSGRVQQATYLAFLRVQIIWSVHISVKRLSSVNKTIPAGQVFVRYWHTEQRPRCSNILPLPVISRHNRILDLSSWAEWRRGIASGKLHACATPLNYKNNKPYLQQCIQRY